MGDYQVSRSLACDQSPGEAEGEDRARTALLQDSANRRLRVNSAHAAYDKDSLPVPGATLIDSCEPDDAALLQRPALRMPRASSGRATISARSPPTSLAGSDAGALADHALRQVRGAPGAAEGVVDDRRLESTVHHAVGALAVHANAVVLPERGAEQVVDVIGMSVRQRVARLPPALDRVGGFDQAVHW